MNNKSKDDYANSHSCSKSICSSYWCTYLQLNNQIFTFIFFLIILIYTTKQQRENTVLIIIRIRKQTEDCITELFNEKKQTDKQTNSIWIDIKR